MSSLPRIARVLLVAAGLYSTTRAADDIGPFFEPEFPFFHTLVDLRSPEANSPVAGNFVVRGVLLPLADGSALVFDQELLRVAGWWRTPTGKPPVTLQSMAQTSYAEPHRKAGAEFPKPTGSILLANAQHPGIATSLESLASDPRKPGAPGENGRGALPLETWHFEGIELAGSTALLHYRCGKAEIVEWHEAHDGALLRHFEVGPHPESLYLQLDTACAGQWTVPNPNSASSGNLIVKTNTGGLTLHAAGSDLVGNLTPSTKVQRFSVGFSDKEFSISASTPAKPRPSKERRWSGTVETTGKLDAVKNNGLTFDSIGLPLGNPWKRRVRIADLVFLSSDQAAIVTFDGDVWLASGLGTSDLKLVSWQRFASGLNEPLSIALNNGILQVSTRNGLVRVHDRDGNGEADWFENFSDVVVQSQNNRTFPLDMDVAPDGSTYISQGGALFGKGAPTFAGAVTRISPDGTRAEIISTHGREPYVTVHPRTGLITGTDQQGHYIPSSVCYYIRPGDNFGFGEDKPTHLTPPLTWIPHTEDNSSSSQVWLLGKGMGSLDGSLLHLSYGRGIPFLISPDFDAPIPQGAVIPLGLETDMPLLQGRMHPSGDGVFVCGFQIYDSRTKNNWGFGRIHLSGTLTTPVQARSCADGVILTFSSPLDPASVNQDHVTAASWNYIRSSQYGSGRYTASCAAGVDFLPVGQVVLSTDRKSVFVHLPGLKPVMQLEVRHEFALQGGAAANGVVYFTVHQLKSADLAKAGFPGVDLARSVPVVHMAAKQQPTAALGKALSETVGCIACHSVDGTTQGKTGPTWKNLFGKDRTFSDGSIESANETYIRTSILEPQKKIVTGYQPGMPSYQGVLTDDQIESLILYIRSLQ